MPTTEELVKAARQGDQGAFAQLVVVYERAAIVTAQAVLGDLDLAQDAAQDGFVTAYTKLDQLQAAAAFGPWLLKSCRLCRKPAMAEVRPSHHCGMCYNNMRREIRRRNYTRS